MGDQDAASGVAEVLAAVGLAGAPTGAQSVAGVLGLDAVAKPVGAGGGARLVGQGVDQALAIAAAAMVTAINGHPIDESAFGEDALQWITRVHPASDLSLTRLAHQAISRVIGPNSELPELWNPESLPSWRSAMAELLDKLNV